MSQWKENCFQIYFDALGDYLVKNNQTEKELKKLLGRIENNQQVFLMASLNVMEKALAMGTEEFQADKLEGQVVEYRFLYEFGETLKNAIKRIKDRREALNRDAAPKHSP